MDSPVPYLFQLILNSRLDYPLDVIYRDPKLSQASTQKNLKIISYNRNYHIGYNFLFILLPSEQNLILESNNGKDYLVETPDSRRNKVYFALLNIIVSNNIKLISIHTQCSSFKRSLLGIINVSRYRGPERLDCLEGPL